MEEQMASILDTQSGGTRVLPRVLFPLTTRELFQAKHRSKTPNQTLRLSSDHPLLPSELAQRSNM